ncbi:MAG: hypothetical protein JEZ03_04310 [Bacteroidales bacterium]|nr:hypothetical protein [Bacteroidales bacterium]
MYYYMGLICKVKPGIKNLVVLLIVNLILIYSHYFGFFVLALQFLYLLLSKNLRTKYWKPLLISTAVIGLFYLPNIMVLISRFLESSDKGTWVAAPNGFASIYSMLRQFTNAPVLTIIALVILLSASIKYLIVERFRKIESANTVVVTWFLFPFLFMFFISYWIPMFLDRYLMFVSIGFYLVLALAANYLIKAKYYSYIFPFIVVVMFIVTSKPNITNKRNAREAVEKVSELKDSSTMVLVCPDHFVTNYAYYHDVEIFKNTKTMNEQLAEQNIYAIKNIKEVDYSRTDHILYLDAAANFSYPNNNIFNRLNQKYIMENKFHFYEVFDVYEFRLKN